MRYIFFKALFCTGNQSIDEAVDYVYSTQEELNDFKTESQLIGPEINGLLDIEHVEDEEDMQYYKMIFVVNTSLKMGVGKIAAQVFYNIYYNLHYKSNNYVFRLDMHVWAFTEIYVMILKKNLTIGNV